MDYRAIFLLAFGLFGIAAAWLLLRTRTAPPRPDRIGADHGTAWVQVDIRYAVITLIFIAFDMEMIYMFPWAVAYLRVGTVAFWDMFVFAAILAVGLVYAWKRGAFDL